MDKYRLGPLFKFLHQHQIVDSSGKVVGYTDLNKVGESIKPILIRRTKKEVLKQLPERLDKNYFVPVTADRPYTPHRIGQHKPVNVINFISKGTIEENLLGLLSFKKSVFAGVLDNGENIVFMGEGKLKQFMNSVAKAIELVGQSEEPLSVETPMSAQPGRGHENPPTSPFFKGG